MLTFGEQLLRPTPRDESTLLVDPYRAVLTGSTGSGTTVNLDAQAVPQDRCLYLHSFIAEVQLQATAADGWWTRITMQAFSKGNAIQKLWEALGNTSLVDGPMQFDNQAPVTTGGTFHGGAISKPLKVVLPPGWTPRLTVTRSGLTNARTVNCWIFGYLIPPMGIGRDS